MFFLKSVDEIKVLSAQRCYFFIFCSFILFTVLSTLPAFINQKWSAPTPPVGFYIGGIGDDHSSRRDSNPGLPLAKRMRYHYTTRARVINKWFFSRFYFLAQLKHSSGGILLASLRTAIDAHPISRARSRSREGIPLLSSTFSIAAAARCWGRCPKSPHLTLSLCRTLSACWLTENGMPICAHRLLTKSGAASVSSSSCRVRVRVRPRPRPRSRPLRRSVFST